MSLFKKTVSYQRYSAYFNKCFFHNTCYLILSYSQDISSFHVEQSFDMWVIWVIPYNFCRNIVTCESCAILYIIDGWEIPAAAMAIHNQKDRVVCQCVNILQNLLIKQQKYCSLSKTLGCPFNMRFWLIFAFTKTKRDGINCPVAFIRNINVALLPLPPDDNFPSCFQPLKKTTLLLVWTYGTSRFFWTKYARRSKRIFLHQSLKFW